MGNGAKGWQYRHRESNEINRPKGCESYMQYARLFSRSYSTSTQEAFLGPWAGQLGLWSPDFALDSQWKVRTPESGPARVPEMPPGYVISTLLIICNNVTVRNSWPCVTDIPEVKTMYSGSGMVICHLMNINEIFVQYPIHVGA